ncbi:MAG: hypothetical protein MUE73_00230 [Planctomycetes bacterium]|jgi:hypothetical protein|nr:hypothetical protein [Planctomycetota bacterium]
MGKLAVALLILLPLLSDPGADPAYPGPGEVEAVLRATPGDLPLGRLAEIGRSRQDRPILALLSGLPGPLPIEGRPRLLVVAGLAADHRVGTATALALPKALARLAAADSAVAELLSRCAVEIVPLVNPDGLAALLAGPEREFRGNLGPRDDDRDGRLDEDPPRDLDGDGFVTWMRVPDPAGPLRISPEDPRLLVPADGSRFERGSFHLLPEGLDSDGDGEVAEDGPGGVDLDRNFPCGGDRYDPRRGPAQPSEPESRALAGHLVGNPLIAAVLVYGRHDNLSGVPPANRAQGRAMPDGPFPDDVPLFSEAARRFADTAATPGALADPPAGAFHHFAYFCRGLPAFATPLFREPPAGDHLLPSGAKPASADARWLAWSDAALDGAGFRSLAPFDHPTLGPVEIGGFAPLFRLNPPPDALPALADAQARFVTALLGLLPRPSLRAVEVRELAPGAHEVRVTLVNEGAFPLATAMGERQRTLAPLRLSVEPAAAVLAGPTQALVWRLPESARTFRFTVAGMPGDRLRVLLASPRFPPLEAEVIL